MTVIFNRNGDHHNFDLPVAVAADQNFLIFYGWSLKSLLGLRWCIGQKKPNMSHKRGYLYSFSLTHY